ncbi:hypothetical protein [Burkholderia lata]|uniref:hypothetical protein n=1 Tax=Burkholderia lata (strain ATCC 17760 / DSM 23089 / LMG 22485 / NCIMB 9086 / R18194 / 383) TaxID=482957 RepID=UPI0012EAB487|nr:hypothetical protein [Burkholderia lata]
MERIVSLFDRDFSLNSLGTRPLRVGAGFSDSGLQHVWRRRVFIRQRASTEMDVSASCGFARHERSSRRRRSPRAGRYGGNIVPVSRSSSAGSIVRDEAAPAAPEDRSHAHGVFRIAGGRVRERVADLSGESQPAVEWNAAAAPVPARDLASG